MSRCLGAASWLQVLVFLAWCLRAVAVPAPDASGKYTIQSKGIKASFIPYSAAVTNLWIADCNGTQRDIVLGYDDAETYATDKIHPNYGAVPGRYTNRIVNATYELDGKRYYTQRNDGNSTIHSGTNGWSYRTWNVTAVTRNSITFELHDTDNSSMGMPGLVVGRAIYTLSPHTWHIRLEAEARTHRTPIMLTNHAYWNLNAFANPANDTVLAHKFSMPFSRRIIEYDAGAMPDGKINHIPRHSINDFYSAPKDVGANDTANGWIGNCGPGFGGYDCGWLVDRSGSQEARAPIVSMWSEWTGIRWDMFSNSEGVTMTSCGFVPPKLLPIKKTQGGPANDGFVPPYGCIAVEPHDWMSGINFPEWGRSDKQIWGPEKGTYVNDIVYRFSLQH